MTCTPDAKPMPPRHAETLADELRRAAAEAPERPFLRMVHGQWSYRQIDEESDRVAAGLHALGVRPRDNVSLMLPNGCEFVVVWFALAKLGAVTAPVNTSFRGPVLAQAIDLVDSRLLIAHASLRDQWGEVRGALATIEQVVEVGGDGTAQDTLPYTSLRDADPAVLPPPSPPVGFADLCLLLYTSGTTGRYKAAMI